MGLLLALMLIVALGLRLWMALVQSRYFDDHYVFNNIATFLKGSLRPRHSYYGSLSYLPQAMVLSLCDALHSLTGIDALRVHGDRRPFEGFTLGAFLLMRMFIVGYALLSIVMIYLVGRRLFSPGVGLAAAAVLAAYPQHLRSSIQLKPDMLALLLTLLTLYWTAGAVQSPRLSRFLLAGAGVGLATSAKYIGVASALPLAAWALWSGFRDRRRWGWLVLAGLTSVATFFALNPFLSKVFHYAFRVTKFYAHRARGERSDHLVVLRREIEFVASQHGWILGAFLLLGTGFLIDRLWRGPGDGERGAALLPLTLFLGYPALHAAGMTLFRSHNLLPAQGGSALVCAYGIVRSGEWLGQRLAFARAPLLAPLLWILPGGLLLAWPIQSTYTRLVPNTWASAERVLRLKLAPLRSRHVVYEPADVQLRLAEGAATATARTAARSLTIFSSSWLDLADAEVFPLSRTEGSQAAFYLDRRRRLAQECAWEIRPQLFRHRGTPLLILFHPWAPAGNPVPIGFERSSGPPGGLVARLPADLVAGEVLSVELVRPARGARRPLLLQPGRQNLPLHYAGRRRYRIRFTSPRFRYTAGLTGLYIPTPARADPSSFQLKLWRWAEEPCPE
ncbi:MAG TPA: glycosyltransferase family 39 protein [Thermoanaerobaculia bacterium]|nr:glycosyltransferase family 39 protein [Thermoanaerobaculia bacterium]